MVGREIVTRVREHGEQDLTADKEMLTVTNLTSEPYFRDISFVLREGEILGLGGLVGSGRTEIAETIYGLRSAQRGRVEVEGVALAHRTPRDCVDAGLIYLPEDRGRHGIFSEVEVTRNVTAGVIHRLPSRGPLLRPAAERRMAEEATKTTAVRMPSIDALMKTLSGGNQQRSMLARWLLAEPKVAIFDEPTRGVDIGAKDDIRTLVNKLAHEGLACLLISSELTELTMICDRVWRSTRALWWVNLPETTSPMRGWERWWWGRWPMTATGQALRSDLQTPGETGEKARSRLVTFLTHREVQLLVALLLMSGIVDLLRPQFLSSSNISFMLAGWVVIMVVATGQTMVIITRGIDLSVAPMLGIARSPSDSWPRTIT